MGKKTLKNISYDCMWQPLKFQFLHVMRRFVPWTAFYKLIRRKERLKKSGGRFGIEIFFPWKRKNIIKYNLPPNSEQFIHLFFSAMILILHFKKLVFLSKNITICLSHSSSKHVTYN